MAFTAQPAPISRMVARGRPFADDACAGCPQLGLFRGLRRAGLGVQGGLGCDPDARAHFAPAAGRWAAVAGCRRILADARAVLASCAAAGARLVVVADRGPGGAGVEAALSDAGARPIRIDPGDLAGTENVARVAAERGGVVLVAISACSRGTPRSEAFAVAASRCNRCGACLALGCPAIADPGDEGMAIDRAICTGCGLCAPLCRSRAIVR